MMKSNAGRFGISAVLVSFTCLALPSDPATAEQNKSHESEFRRFENFDRTEFENPTKIDNKYLPMKPGMQLIYKGHTREGKKRVPHAVVFTVTDMTKVIDGVRTVVCYDRDYQDGALVEPELIFFAQDNDGNVWHFGQYREMYIENEFVGGQAWLAGIEGARAGIMMKAQPRLGAPSYSEGYAPPPFNWTDRAKTERMGQKTCVPAGCYEDVLVNVEFSKEEGPNAQQIKYYAPGVGPVRIGWRGKGEKTRETLELSQVRQLGPEELAKIRAEALELEKRASIYGRTPPAEYSLGATRP
jgi:hypothetical protein